jgi:hypothetical protein
MPEEALASWKLHEVCTQRTGYRNYSHIGKTKGRGEKG